MVSTAWKLSQIRSFFWPAFSCIRTEYGDLIRKSPYSVLIQENTDQKKIRIWTVFTQLVNPTFGVAWPDKPTSYKSSVIRQKGESQNGCYKKTKHAKFSEKRTFGED